MVSQANLQPSRLLEHPSSGGQREPDGYAVRFSKCPCAEILVTVVHAVVGVAGCEKIYREKPTAARGFSRSRITAAACVARLNPGKLTAASQNG